jgi:regulator of replication initiation timing
VDWLVETEKRVQAASMSPALQQEIGLLNLRLNDLGLQFNKVVKLMVEENAALRLEVAELKAKLPK